MAILIDDTMATAFLTMPVQQGWIEAATSVQVRSGLRAADVTEDDVALLPIPEATLLTETHVVDRSVAIVHDGAGMVAMRTAVRPDEIDEAIVHLQDVGPSGEALVRALLTPYFGIAVSDVVRDVAAPADASVVVLEGAEALAAVEDGFQEDLARSWFIMTGRPYVSHVTVVGVRALARDADAQLATLRAARDTGWERRRDVRLALRDAMGVDAGRLTEVTGNMRFALAPEEGEAARMLVERGMRGTSYGRSLPAFRDQVGPT